MKRELLDILRCPQCGATFDLLGPQFRGNEIETGSLACSGTERHLYPITDSIPRFVPAENYAANFGFQWNRFRETQLDSYSGTHISRDRFFISTGWEPKQLAGKRVLDAGCGAGRFAEIALASGATVVALDYSTAVDACWLNNREKGTIHCVQGDIYHLPFASGSFDYVYCLGVLQHTPDVEKAFLALVAAPRAGGKLAVDVYPRSWQSIISGKDLLRPLTKRMDRMRLFSLVEKLLVPLLLPVSFLVGRIPLIGRKVRRLLPVSNYQGVFPLSPAQLREWAVLDTYDMLAPTYDNPQTPATLREWLSKARLRDVEVKDVGHLVGRGTK
jgi:SAM-dependent methyltransferase